MDFDISLDHKYTFQTDSPLKGTSNYTWKVLSKTGRPVGTIQYDSMAIYLNVGRRAIDLTHFSYQQFRHRRVDSLQQARKLLRRFFDSPTGRAVMTSLHLHESHDSNQEYFVASYVTQNGKFTARITKDARGFNSTHKVTITNVATGEKTISTGSRKKVHKQWMAIHKQNLPVREDRSLARQLLDLLHSTP